MTSSDALKRTPFHARHVAAGAKMVPFAGFEMPVTYPKGQGATPQHHDSSASAFTSMKCIEPIVPRYVTPGSTFVAFAHNYDHTRHHLQDHRKAIEVLEMLDCIEDDLVIVECVFGRDNTQVAVKEHSFDSYFGR
jgi:hypothetical protein